MACDRVVLRRAIELSLKSLDQESLDLRVRMGRKNRGPQIPNVTDDVRLPALLTEYVSNIGEACGTLLPQRARSHLAILNLRGERNARKRFMFSQRAGNKLSGPLTQNI